MQPSFLDLYLLFTQKTESPYIYHRWSALTGIGAILGRNFYLQHGSNRIYPTLYCMVVGQPGVRKTTAIRSIRKITAEAGYKNFAADKTTKEKFLLDLQGGPEDFSSDQSNSRRGAYDRTTAQNLWGPEDDNDLSPREIFVTADEFNDFAGQNNVDFCRLLGVLWDFEGVYKSRIKNGVSVAVPEPTVSIMAGITPQDFANTFSPDLMGMGFISRLLLIHGEQSDRKYTIPPTPPEELKKELIEVLTKIQREIRGSAEVTPEAFEILDSIYHGWPSLQDVRFRSYSTRRFTQLLRLVLICTAGRLSKRIEPDHVIEANTYLTAAEVDMPLALGQFGKGKNSDIADKIMTLLSTATKPLDFKAMWAEVHKDLDKASDLALIIQGLETADKVYRAEALTGKGWLPKAPKKIEHKHVDWKYLTEEERKRV